MVPVCVAAPTRRYGYCTKGPAMHRQVYHLYPSVLHAGRDQSEINYVLLPEVLDYAARLDRILTQPGGSLLVVGRSGAGRRTLLQLMAYAHNIVIATPKITRSYALKHFKTDLKLVCAVLFFRLFFPS